MGNYRESLISDSEQILLPLKDRETILNDLFSQGDTEKGIKNEENFDSSFLYRGKKGVELYTELSESNNYPYTEIEMQLLYELINHPKIIKAFKDSEHLIDSGSGNGGKGALLLKLLLQKLGMNAWTGKYIGEDNSPDMWDQIVQNFRDLGLRDKVGAFLNPDDTNSIANQFERNFYLFLGGTIGNMSDTMIINKLKNMNSSSILSGSRILLSYYKAPKNEEEIEKLKKIYKSEKDIAFHKNGMAMLGLSEDDFEYEVVYEEDKSKKTKNSIPGRIKGVIRAKRDMDEVRMTDGKTIRKKIKAGQQFTIHYSRRFSEEEIKSLFKESGCKTVFTRNKEGVSIALLSKRPTKPGEIVGKTRNELLSILICLLLPACYTRAVDKLNGKKANELITELVSAEGGIEDHTQEINQLVYALKLDELRNEDDKQIIFSLYNDYLNKHKGDGTSKENLIKGFYKELGLTLIKKLGVIHSPYDFITPSSINLTKNIKYEFSITPTSIGNNIIRLPKFSYDYGEFPGVIINQSGIFNPNYTFEYNDGGEKYLILQAIINRGEEQMDIYMGAKKKDGEKYPTFSTKTITDIIQDKSGLDPKIVSNTNKLGGNFINKGKIHVGNTNFILVNTNEDMIMKTGNMSTSLIKPDCIYLNGKIYFIIKIPTASGKEILLASESIYGPFSISNFKEIANDFCIAWDIPLN